MKRLTAPARSALRTPATTLTTLGHQRIGLRSPEVTAHLAPTMLGCPGTFSPEDTSHNLTTLSRKCIRPRSPEVTAHLDPTTLSCPGTCSPEDPGQLANDTQAAPAHAASRTRTPDLAPTTLGHAFAPAAPRTPLESSLRGHAHVAPKTALRLTKSSRARMLDCSCASTRVFCHPSWTGARMLGLHLPAQEISPLQLYPLVSGHGHQRRHRQHPLLLEAASPLHARMDSTSANCVC
ncbi:unnamed protein product [Sphagnum tenellum]